MSFPNPSPGDSVAANDIDEIRNHLEGGSGKTAPYKLRQSTGDFIVVLADNAGASELSIHDSDDVEVAHIDSNGNATFTTTTFTNLDIPTSASPSQTADGRAVWDSDDDKLTIGDGTSRKTFIDETKVGMKWEGGDQTERTTTSGTDVTLSTITVSIPVERWILILVNARKTAGAAAAAALGIEMNGTQVHDTQAITSTANQAERTLMTYYIPPRRAVTTYTGAWGLGQNNAGATVNSLTVATALADTVTSIEIEGNGGGTNTLAIDEVQVFSFGTGA